MRRRGTPKRETKQKTNFSESVLRALRERALERAGDALQKLRLEGDRAPEKLLDQTQTTAKKGKQRSRNPNAKLIFLQLGSALEEAGAPQTECSGASEGLEPAGTRSDTKTRQLIRERAQARWRCGTRKLEPAERMEIKEQQQHQAQLNAKKRQYTRSIEPA